MTEEEIKQEEKPADSADEKIKELKAKNDILELEIERNKRLKNEAILAGKSVLNPPQKPETPEEKWAREAKLRYAGTGMDPT